jgi:hypothetical protein
MSHRRYQTCGFVGARNFLGLTAHARTPCKTYERMRPGNQTNHTRRSRRPGMGANAKGPRAKRTIGEEANGFLWELAALAKELSKRPPKRR